MEYKVICSAVLIGTEDNPAIVAAKGLEPDMRLYIEDGWKPQGGITLTVADDMATAAQAIVRGD